MCGPREGHDGVRGGEPPRVDINTNIRLPPSLRAAADMPYRDGKVTRYMPGLLAKIDGPDGKGVGLQQTYLTESGEKARATPVRKTLGSPLPAGACVRLSSPKTSAASPLGIAEGIETALSAGKLFGVPVWAALNTALLTKWEPPAGVDTVMIFADADGERRSRHELLELEGSVA
jgi:putative DNA primase/helicase